MFIALTVAMGFAFAPIPNVEMVTTTVFIAGFLLGPAQGTLIGFTGEFLYSLLSPYGFAMPTLLAAQVLSMALAGFVGGLLGRRLSEVRVSWITAGVFAGIGLALTFIFDALTTLGFLILSGLSIAAMIQSFIFGLGFYVTHLATNTIIFGVVVPPALRVLRYWPFLKSEVAHS